MTMVSVAWHYDHVASCGVELKHCQMPRTSENPAVPEWKMGGGMGENSEPSSSQSL